MSSGANGTWLLSGQLSPEHSAAPRAPKGRCCVNVLGCVWLSSLSVEPAGHGDGLDRVSSPASQSASSIVSQVANHLPAKAYRLPVTLSVFYEADSLLARRGLEPVEALSRAPSTHRPKSSRSFSSHFCRNKGRCKCPSTYYV